jgi:hypothetical protein
MPTIIKRIFHLLRPRYNELMTFLTTVITILVWVIYPEALGNFAESIGEGGKEVGWFCMVGLLTLTGMVISIKHIFVRDKKHPFEKTVMGVFVMGANGLAGIAAGIEILPKGWSILALFPIWNILTGVVLIYQIGFVDASVVTDEDASPLEVIVGTASLIALFFVSVEILNYSWAMTFSLCMFYSFLFAALFSRLIYFFKQSRI